MHHSPAPPPPSVVLRAVLADWWFRLRGTPLSRRGRRAWPVLVVVASVTAVVLAVPAFSGQGSSLLLDGGALDAAAAAAAGSSESSSPDEEATEQVPPAGSATSVPGTALPSAESPDPLAVPSAAAPSSTDSAPSSPPPSSSPSSPSAAGTAPAPTAPAAVPAPAGMAGTGLEGQVLALVNVERATAGCAAVVADAGLAGVARAHSADMRDRGFFDHVNPSSQDPWARAAAAGVGNARAENIARGQADPAEVMTAWMNSPGHRANILDCGLRTLGVGVAEGPNGPWWTQLFGG